MKKLIIVANDIEASGNSTVSRALSNYLSEQEVKHLSVTSDEKDFENGFNGEFWDFDDDFGISDLIDALDHNEAVILDIKSGMARLWADFCEEHEVDTLLSEMDVEMTTVVPCNSSERANEEVVDLAELFADQSDYVIAHMPIEARRSREVDWKKSEAAKVCKYLGAVEIKINPLGSEFQAALDSSEFTSVSALDNLADAPRFLEVQAMQWLEDSVATFSQADDYLLPEEAEMLVHAY